MIVFYGYPDELPMRMAIAAATERNVDRLVINQTHASEDDIVLELGDGVAGYFIVAGQRVDFQDITAVYARPLAPVLASDSAAGRRAEAWHLIITEWLNISPALVVNRPSAMASNGSKPFQQQLIAEHFAVPDTLVTSCAEEVRRFWADHGEIIYKSVSGIRSIVRRLDGASAMHLDRLAALPTQFQAYVPGVDIRVHVVGSAVFGTEVRSGAVDYRYAQRDGLKADLAAVRLDEEVTRRCAALAVALDLPFCGIDLRRRPDGQYVCFEVNPMPGFSYYEAETGAPISSALVDLLSAK
ncbi:ATP-grasp domain-containing protein [Nocardia gipuzkoensis]